MKTCNKCLVEKDLQSFSKRTRSKDGFQPVCKQCATSYHQNWSSVNKDRVNQKAKEWVISNPDKRRANTARYRQNNLEKTRAATRRSMSSNPAKYKAIEKQWRLDNPEKNREKLLRRRVSLAGNGVFRVTAKDIKQILSKPCFYCGSKSDHIDHVLPISRGGRHSVGNLVAACAKCNLSKSDKFIVEWKVGA